MTVEQYLSGYRDALKDIESLKKELTLCRESLESITQGYSDMPGGGDSLGHQRDAEARLADKSRQVLDAQRRAEKVREDIRSFIFSINGNDRHTRNARIFLEYYYCVALDITGPNGIAKKMDVTPQTVYNIRYRAMDKAERLWRKLHR